MTHALAGHRAHPGFAIWQGFWLAAAALVLPVMLLVMAPSPARPAPDSFADLAERLSPSVVNISTRSTVSRALNNANPLDELFRRNRPGVPNVPPGRRGTSVGAGFIISSDGFIVTNHHVVENADQIRVELFDGAGEFDATVIGSDKDTDIAVLKVETDAPLPAVAFGDSDLVRVGDWVIAIGNPLGQGFSVSAGIISARNRELQGNYDDYLQTDAAINRGNSGGPLFNMEGEVVGVNTAILSTGGGGSIGLGFSMASNVVTRVVNQLKAYGETRRGWLGVGIQDVTPDMAEAMSLESAAGAAVTEVHPNGPAEAAGLQQNDVILSFDGQTVTNTDSLVRMVGATEVGKSVRVVVSRDGGTETLKVVLGRREDAVPALAAIGGGSGGGADGPAETTLLGISLSVLTDALRTQYGLEDTLRGVVVTAVDSEAEAFEKGLRSGDVITEIGQQPVAVPADVLSRFEEAREAGRRSVLLLVVRDGQPRFIAISTEE